MVSPMLPSVWQLESLQSLEGKLSLKNVMAWTAVLIAFLSAYFWFKASTVVVTAEDKRHNPGVEMHYTDKKTGKEVAVVATAMEQSRLNKIAAVFTGLAVLLQALGTALT